MSLFQDREDSWENVVGLRIGLIFFSSNVHCKGMRVGGCSTQLRVKGPLKSVTSTSAPLAGTASVRKVELERNSGTGHLGYLSVSTCDLLGMKQAQRKGILL